MRLPQQRGANLAAAKGTSFDCRQVQLSTHGLCSSRSRPDRVHLRGLHVYDTDHTRADALQLKSVDPSAQLPHSSLFISGLSYNTAFKSEL